MFPWESGIFEGKYSRVQGIATRERQASVLACFLETVFLFGKCSADVLYAVCLLYSVVDDMGGMQV